MIPAHGVYWPIMLKALGFTDDEHAHAPRPRLVEHQSKSGESEKMSKSLGNVIDPDVLADKYGPEAVRYYLMSDIATGRDADFSEERLIQRYNTDLANSLGNLLNRSLSMAAKYRERSGARSRACAIRRCLESGGANAAQHLGTRFQRPEVLGRSRDVTCRSR